MNYLGVSKFGAVLGVSALSLFIAAPAAFSGGFQLWEDDTTGLASVHAGDAASSDNAGSQFYNPASMTDFDHTAITSGGVAILLDTQVNSGAVVYAPGEQVTTEPVLGNTQNIVPSFAIVTPLSDKWSIGFSESTPFGLSTSYPDNGTFPSSDWDIANYATETTIRSINLNPNIAYAISPQWSVGAGFDALYGSAVYDNSTLTNSFNGWDYGFNAGVLYKASEKWHFGLSYRSQIDITVDGDSTFDLGRSSQTNQGSIDLPLPATTMLSATEQMSSRWQMLYSVFYTQWDVIDDLVVDNSGVYGEIITVPQNYKNTWFVSVGSTYQLTDQWALRGGVGYDQTPTQDGYRDARMPDSDHYLVGIGASLRPNQHLCFDFGYQHVFMKDAPLDGNVYFSETSALDLSMTGTSTSSANLLGMQVSYDFG